VPALWSFTPTEIAAEPETFPDFSITYGLPSENCQQLSKVLMMLSKKGPELNYELIGIN
jgi:hypothetical protein